MAKIIVRLVSGSLRTGLWCEPCALPSRVEVDVHMVTSRGVTRVGTATSCTEAEHGRR